MSLFSSSQVKRGLKQMEQKHYEEALKHFSLSIEKGEELDDAHFHSGACYFELGDFPSAKKHLHIALDLNSGPERTADILEIVNWNMISSYHYFNSCQSFSPDGSTMAFTSARRDTNGDGRINALDGRGIYTVVLATGAEERLVGDETINCRPIFSPDQTTIAFLSQRQRGQAGAGKSGLFMVDIATREVTALAQSHNVKYHLFSRDGKIIYFCGWKEGDKNSGIYSLNMESGAVETVVPGTFENTFPSLSPRGDALLYTSWHSDTNGDGIIDFHDNSGIYIRDLSTGKERELVSPTYNNTFPVFSADGQQIIYLSVRRDTNGDGTVDSLDNAGIYLMDVESGREKCIVDDTFYNKFPALSSDGKKMVFVTSGCHFRVICRKNDFFEQKGIYALDMAKKEFYQIIPEQYYGSRAPVLSPKGDKVAYVSWRKGTNRGLYLADLDKLPLKSVLHEWIERNL